MGCFKGSESKSTSDSKTGKQREGIDKALDVYLPELGKGADIFPDKRVTPFSTLQQKSLTGAENFADYFSEPEKAGTPLFGETGQAAKGLLSGRTGGQPITEQQTADYFGRAIYDPTMKNLRQDVIPGIAESFAGPGFHGSGRSQEESRAFKDTADWLGTQRAGLEWDVMQSNQALAEGKAGRSLATLSPAMAFGQIPAQEIRNNLEIAASKVSGLSQLFGFGQAEQTQAQAELQDEIMRFAEENQITDPENLEILLALLNMNFSAGRSTSGGPGLGYAATTSFLGGFGQGAGQQAGANIFA